VAVDILVVVVQEAKIPTMLLLQQIVEDTAEVAVTVNQELIALVPRPLLQTE
jgi:hypothetical protein